VAQRRGARSGAATEARALEINRRLRDEYPEALCELTHRNPFELLAATIMSAQTTDVRVNMVTPALFARYPDAESLAEADIESVEQIIKTVGLYPSKARNLIKMARLIVDEFDGEVPRRREDLVTLPGVGRKTANVVRSVAFGLPGLAVDTHVGRLSRRLGLTDSEDPVKVELELNEFIPPYERGEFSLRLILHGRRVCDARKPACDRCMLADLCPAYARP
jgi:endonuclease-3